MIENAEAILKGPVGESAGDVVVKLRRGGSIYMLTSGLRGITQGLRRLETAWT